MSSVFDDPALGQLKDAYFGRLAAARAAKAAGQTVVGVVGNTVPVELILALGAFPVQVAADLPHLTPTADTLIEKTEPWPMRSMADRALDGTLAVLDLLVITRIEEWLYYNLKEAVRIGEGARVPPLHIHDLLQNHKPQMARYNRAQLDLLIERLQRLAGATIEPEKVRTATRLTNRVRGLLRDVEMARADGRLTGVEAMTIIGAGRFLHPRAYADLLDAGLKSLKAPAAKAGPRVIVVTSEPIFHLELHKVLEDAGLSVVGEDTWWGSRAGGDDIALDGDPIARVHDATVFDSQGEDVQPREAREAWVRARTEQGDVDGVIFYLPADKRYGWGVPRLKAHIEEHGLGSVIISRNVLQPEGREAVAEAAAAFAKTVALTGADA